jgi:hypothetical protein
MREIILAQWEDYTVKRVTRSNGTGYYQLDDGWVCDYPIVYDSGSVAFDNPEYFDPAVISKTITIVSAHKTLTNN